MVFKIQNQEKNMQGKKSVLHIDRTITTTIIIYLSPA